MRSPRRSWRGLLVLIAVCALCGLLFLQDRIISLSSASPGPVRAEGAANSGGTLVTISSPSSCPQVPGRSLWVGGRKLVSALAPDSGCVALTAPAEQVEDIAVDNDRGMVWVATRQAVIQFDFSGRELFRYSLRRGEHHDDGDHDDNRRDSVLRGDRNGIPAGRHDDDDDADHDDGGRDRIRLSLDPSDGSLWIGAGHAVVKLSAEGRVLAEMQGIGRVTDVSVDISDGACWVGAEDQIARYSSDGVLLNSFGLDQKNKVIALAADPRDHHLWIGSEKGIIKVDGQGMELLRAPIAGRLRDLAANLATGALWVVTDDSVHHYGREGQPVFGKSFYAESGEEDDHNGGPADDGLVALAVDSADNTCWLAGKSTLWKLSQTGEQLLALMGFRLIEALDIGMPKLGITITAPREGETLTDSPLTTVTGTITDSTAKVLVNGRNAAVAGLTFEALDILLSAGVNTITAAATNLVRQSASDSVHVFYQAPKRTPFFLCAEPYWEQGPQPPVPGCAQQALVNEWNYSRAYVLGYAEETTSAVTVDGVTLPSGVEIHNQGRIIRGLWSGTFFWALVNLSGPDGPHPVTAAATNAQGSMQTAVVTIIKDTVPPHVSISSPTSGTITSGSTITVSGTLDDPAAMVSAGWGGQAIPVVNGTFRATYDLESWDGPQTLFVTATDPAMNYGYASVQIVRDTTPPQIGITMPADGVIVSTQTVSIRGTLIDATPESIAVSVNGGQPQPLLLSGTAVSGLVSLASGSNSIHIAARDKAGNAAAITRSIILDNESPAVAITSPLPHATLSGQATVAVAASDGISGVQSVSLLMDGMVQEVCTHAPCLFTVDTLRLAAGSHTITVMAVDRAGNAAEAAIPVIVEKHLGIEILSPQDGSTISGSTAFVRGKIYPFDNREAGVVVNGIPAHQNGSDFAAIIPLQAGQNTITAVISNAYGITEQTAVSISVVGSSEPVRMIAVPNSGIPLPKPDGSMHFETSLQAEAYLAGAPVSYAWDVNGDGFADQQGAVLTTVTASFTTPGLYYPSVTVTDSLGNTAIGTTVVNVIDRAAIDVLLQAKWEGMKNRLLVRDVDAALSFFLPKSQQRYKDIFTALGETIAQMAQDMRSIQQVYIKQNIAKYRIRRNEMYGGQMAEITYYIYFTMDASGIWKIAYF